MKLHAVEHLIGQLNALSRIATLENAPRSRQFATALVDVLRYRVARHGQVVRGATELAAVDALLLGVSLRFEDTVEIAITGRAVIEPLFIPHLTLMTFVENAVFHAPGNHPQPLRIAVNAEAHAGGTRIEIVDTGSGFDPSARQTEPQPDADYGTIASTAHRLLAYYRTTVVQIDSAPGAGTRVILTLPGEAA